MSYAIIAIGALLTAMLQVTIVPMFTLGGATADLGMIAILVTLLAMGPRSAMVMTPAVALTVALSSNRSPALMLVAYTAVLPIGYLLDRFAIPPGAFPRLLLTAAASGLWIRGVLAAGAFATGAELTPVMLVTHVLIPGMIFDAVSISVAFFALKLAGRSQVRYSLQRQGWMA